METRREGNERPQNRGEKAVRGRKNVFGRRDEQLDEELRSQLRKKNEENRKHMGPRLAQSGSPEQ